MTDWSTGWLCKGCGHSLEEPVRPGGEPLIEANTDSEGSFIRCLHCGGKHYYVPNEKNEPQFRYFKPGAHILYRWRRKLGLLGPHD